MDDHCETSSWISWTPLHSGRAGLTGEKWAAAHTNTHVEFGKEVLFTRTHNASLYFIYSFIHYIHSWMHLYVSGPFNMDSSTSMAEQIYRRNHHS